MGSHLEKAFAQLSNPEADARAKHFKIKSGSYIQRRKDALKRKDKAFARKLIKPANAQALVDQFPKDSSDTLHGIVCGDFVMGDVIPAVSKKWGPIEHLLISTLSLSVNNAEALAGLLRKNSSLQCKLLVSHYFKNTNGEIFTALRELLQKPFAERFQLAVHRSHAKIILLETADHCFSIETSANLRSSNNIEQVVVNNDRGVFDFHAEWIEQLISMPADE